jgi:hypothetical protein
MGGGTTKSLNMYGKSIAALASVSLLMASPAFATSVTNLDIKEHTITVDRGAKESQQKIAAGATAQVDCLGGCGFTVEGSGYGSYAGDWVTTVS